MKNISSIMNITLILIIFVNHNTTWLPTEDKEKEEDTENKSEENITEKDKEEMENKNEDNVTESGNDSIKTKDNSDSGKEKGVTFDKASKQGSLDVWMIRLYA